jgi:signal transduction histidine kinase
MWDMATPVVVGGKRLGSLFLGQFLFEDETPDLEIFRSQARQYGFDEEAYLQAFDRVPSWKRETVDIVMSFYTKLANLISELGYSNIRLAGTLKERTRILNAFEKRERFLNEMGRMARIGGWEHDLVTRKATWTKGIYDIIGLKTDVEPPGVDEHLQFCPPKHRRILEEAYRQTAKGGAPFDLELEMNTVFGERLWCRVHGEAVMSGGKCVKMRGIFQDISERRRMEQELARARKLESMGFIAGGLVHDYNNLLSMILGNISMAKEGMGQGESIGSFLDDAEEATLKAKDLTHRLMTLSKESVSHKRLRSVKDSLEGCAGEMPRFSKCVCDVDIDDDLWPAEHDSVQLKNAIRNVIKNAIEAMPKGGVVSLRAENVFLKKGQGGADFPENPGAYLKISVSDQGVGITRGNLGRIFDPYFSTKEMGSRKGMGLGLAIAAAIVDKHDGHLAVNSKRGIGTTVRIYLPARPPDDLNMLFHIPPVKRNM